MYIFWVTLLNDQYETHEHNTKAMKMSSLDRNVFFCNITIPFHDQIWCIDSSVSRTLLYPRIIIFVQNKKLYSVVQWDYCYYYYYYNKHYFYYFQGIHFYWYWKTQNTNVVLILIKKVRNIKCNNNKICHDIKIKVMP